jgi:anti-anti-sigma factor
MSQLLCRAATKRRVVLGKRRLNVSNGTGREADVSGPYRHIGAKSTDGTLVLTIEVEQVKDFTISEELRYELVHAVKSRQSKRIIIDLRNMSFMTSLACVAFIGVRQAMKDVDGRVVLCNMTEFIHKVFSAKRLLVRSKNSGNVAFESAATLEDALAMLAAGGEQPT